MKAKSKFAMLLLGPSIFGAMQFFDPPAGMSEEAFQVLAITFWISIWWITEVVPIAVTALIPIVMFPVTGTVDIASTTSSFGHKYIFLYLGGFLLAIAIEKWDLHRRIALTILNKIGSSVSRIMLGFMLATAFLSMWISNTATSVMMLPIAMAVASQFTKNTVGRGYMDVRKALMLGIAYSASIGGFATLIGTPPNLVLAGVLEETYSVKITFFDWLKFGLPISLVLIVICWKFLTTGSFKISGMSFPGGRQEIKKLLTDMGPITREERVVLWMFVATAVLWVSRSFLERWVPMLDDTIIAMTTGILLFAIPIDSKGKRLITWSDCTKLPWDIILLFGGGMALAKGFGDTGLAMWMAMQLTQLEGLSLILLILVLVAAINFLTEITSNLATTAMLLPILAPMALAFDMHPFMIMVSCTISASCAFMLPVATPPNAVVFGSGYLHIPDMVRAGIFMNLISILVISLFTYFLLPIIWGFVPDQFPAHFQVSGLVP